MLNNPSAASTIPQYPLLQYILLPKSEFTTDNSMRFTVRSSYYMFVHRPSGARRQKHGQSWPPQQARIKWDPAVALQEERTSAAFVASFGFGSAKLFVKSLAAR